VRSNVSPPIFPVAARFLLPLILLFSVFLFLRGHHEPGGAFIAGMVAAAAFTLQTIARGASATRSAFRVPPRYLIGIGFALVVVVASVPLVVGQAVLDAAWVTLEVPGGGATEIGSPILFEAGVYLVVVGSVVTIITAALGE